MFYYHSFKTSLCIAIEAGIWSAESDLIKGSVKYKGLVKYARFSIYDEYIFPVGKVILPGMIEHYIFGVSWL